MNLHQKFVPDFIMLAMSFEVDSALLIYLIEERSCLWDLTSDIYKDKQKRTKAWIEIGEQLVENYMDQSDKDKDELNSVIERSPTKIGRKVHLEALFAALIVTDFWSKLYLENKHWASLATLFVIDPNNNTMLIG